MIVVAGPRIDPASLGAPEGVEVRAFVPTSTAISRPAISRWCRAASPPAWS
jgi:hypothetical protein